jgi:malonyl CoA-acyl carrier protein transacylase
MPRRCRLANPNRAAVCYALSARAVIDAPGFIPHRRPMSRKIALLFSGQGAQQVGMGKDLATRYAVAANLFAEADRRLGRSLSELAFNGPIEELTKTSNRQVALYVHGLALLRVVEEEIGSFSAWATGLNLVAQRSRFMDAAGLSLGEFTAHAAAGTFDFAKRPATRQPVSISKIAEIAASLIARSTATTRTRRSSACARLTRDLGSSAPSITKPIASNNSVFCPTRYMIAVPGLS